MWASISSGLPPSPSTAFCGITVSTPEGLPSTCSSIQSSSISSCSGLNPTAPSTPKPPALLTATTTSRQWVNAKMGRSMPRSSQSGVRMSVGLLRLRGEADGHRLDAVDEIGVEPPGLARQFDVGQALAELAHGGFDLGPGRVGAQAVMDAAPAEGEVVVGCAGDIEGVRV